MMARADQPGPRPFSAGPARGPQRRRQPAAYSRFVRAMKVGLIGIALALVVLVVLWPQLRTIEDEFLVKFASLKGARVDRIEMVNARYFGTDERNRPYAVTAARALEIDADRVELESPKADMTLDQGWIMLNSDKGFYSKSGKTLELVGNVNVFQDEGYEFHTASAIVHVEMGDARGNQPVEGAGAFGWVAGEGFELTDKGKRLLVTGKSKLVLTGVGGTQEGR